MLVPMTAAVPAVAVPMPVPGVVQDAYPRAGGGWGTDDWGAGGLVDGWGSGDWGSGDWGDWGSAVLGGGLFGSS